MKGKTWAPLPGHIIYADVRYSDIEKSKSRFAVVVSNEDYNLKYQELIVAFATRTSQVRHPRAYDVELSSNHPDFKSTGLMESTTVRCGRLWTVSQQKAADVRGIVPSDLLTDIRRLVSQCF